jgi:hypothetical protein
VQHPVHAHMVVLVLEHSCNTRYTLNWWFWYYSTRATPGIRSPGGSGAKALVQHPVYSHLVVLALDTPRSRHMRVSRTRERTDPKPSWLQLLMQRYVQLACIYMHPSGFVWEYTYRACVEMSHYQQGPLLFLWYRKLPGWVTCTLVPCFCPTVWVNVRVPVLYRGPKWSHAPCLCDWPRTADSFLRNQKSLNC